MATLRLQRDLPFPRPAVYDVIADVARYPDFMPGFKAVRTEGWDDDRLLVRQTVGAGGLTTTFLSRARFTPPQGIDIVSHERPFEVLHQTWGFAEAAHGRTRVTLEAEYAMADRVAGAVFNRVFPALLRSGLNAVGRRVATLHGRPGRRGGGRGTGRAP
ncbi:type II toxin-antitoxin system RatA family toxin [Roseospira goensis]|uniref:Coenzyme Q-binding protein COQ10 n=1 Tax=Roseospira goensis TaxID=391922 RepID=A0A7W6WM27_9PROT|nr:SRPBCC family protein [Roseospira goensis]MBB4287489.1 coenzyme Q-binding protein COQ10 [Roseospira goensis]